MFQDKLNRVLNAMKDAGLEQMIVADPASIYYLTGRMILPGERMLVLYLNQNGDHKLILSKLFPQEGEVGVDVIYLMMWRTVWKSLHDMMEKEKKVGVDKIWPAKIFTSSDGTGSRKCVCQCFFCTGRYSADQRCR